jgi:hypothetical protein
MLVSICLTLSRAMAPQVQKAAPKNPIKQVRML